MIDELFQFVRLDNDRVIWICAGRYEHSSRFCKSELKFMTMVEPLIREAVRRHWSDRSFDPDDIQGIVPNHDRFRRSLDDFGAGVLSPREHEVCQLLLRGHSSKSTARVLTISPETERIHRRRVYGKLNVSSQVEVMALLRFFDRQAAGGIIAFEISWQDYFELNTGETSDVKSPFADPVAFYVDCGGGDSKAGKTAIMNLKNCSVRHLTLALFPNRKNSDSGCGRSGRVLSLRNDVMTSPTV